MTDPRPPKSPRKGKHVNIRIAFLNDTVHVFQVPVKGVGSLLWEAVVNHLQLLEADYFDLQYTNQRGDDCWLDKDKVVLKQIHSPDTPLRFCVKFYTPDPGLLEDELTRYLFALQVRKDLLQGDLRCSDNTAALLASYIVQGEIGDFDLDEYVSPNTNYLAAFKFVPDSLQTEEFINKVMDYHRQHIGESPSEADLNLLDTARKVELYGVKTHAAKDHEGVPLNLAVAHLGVLVFQSQTKINTFSWAKVRKLSFKRKKFLIKLHPDTYGYYKDTVEFFFDSRDRCKLFWKQCIEHHAFFRCQMVAKAPRSKARVVSRGSSFRYSGRTQKQLVEFVRENIGKRPHFDRSTSGRISNQSASVTPKFTSKPGIHSSTDLHNNSGSRSSGSHILDSNHTPGSGVTHGETGTPKMESMDIHSDSSMSGSRSLNSPRLEHGMSIDQDVIDAVNARTGGAMTDEEEEDEEEEINNGRVIEGISHVASETKVSSLVAPGLSEKDRKHSAPVFGSGHSDVQEQDQHLSRTPEIENIPEVVEEENGTVKKSPQRRSPPKSIISSSKVVSRRTSNHLDDIDDLPPPPPSPPPLSSPTLPPPPPPFEDLDPMPAVPVIWDNNGSTSHDRHEDLPHDKPTGLHSEAGSLANHSRDTLNSRLSTDVVNHKHDDDDDYEQGLPTETITTPDNKPNSDDTFPDKFSYDGNHRLLGEFDSEDASIQNDDDGGGGGGDGSFSKRTRCVSSRGENGVKVEIAEEREEEQRRKVKLRPTDTAYFIAKELLMTERTYKKDLEVICVWFRNAVSCDPAVLNSTSETLFRYFDPIYNFHFTFLRDVEHRLSVWEGREPEQANGDSQKIGDILLKAINSFQGLYESYFEHLEEILTEMNTKVRKQRQFEEICRGFETQKVCFLPLSTFFLRPGQRLLHFKLILERLVKFHPFTHPDAEDCKEALCQITEITNMFRECFNRMENLEKLMELQRDLIGLDSLVHADRGFIREGCLQKFSRKGYQQRMFFLFSDMLIYSSRTSASVLQFKVHGQLALRGMTVEETDQAKSAVHNSFAVYAGNKYILVAASTQEDKDKWIEDINESVARAKNSVTDKLQYPSLKSSASSSENIGSGELSEGDQISSAGEKSASQHRANTTTHVCWHRNSSVSMRDHDKALKNQLSGYLLRKFKTSSGWQKLWVVFTNFCLFFYKTYQDDFPLASLPLLGYAVNIPEMEDGINKENVFKLQFKNHVYFFRAESAYTFSRWMEVINSATHNARRVRIFSRLDSRLEAS